jgi:hypothetical protein
MISYEIMAWSFLGLLYTVCGILTFFIVRAEK